MDQLHNRSWAEGSRFTSSAGKRQRDQKNQEDAATRANKRDTGKNSRQTIQTLNTPKTAIEETPILVQELVHAKKGMKPINSIISSCH